MAVLHEQYLKTGKNLKEVSDIEKDIGNYIEEYRRDKYEEIIKKDDRWEVFFHLSEMRISLLNWYEFKEGAELLEVDGGFGAVTGMLCERCKHVTTTESSIFRARNICKRYSDYNNLDVYAGDLDDIVFKKKFDYIVLIGVLESQGDGSSEKDIYAGYIRKIFQLLKPEGKLLLAVENRYGIRYFCGATESHTRRAFDGINRYPYGTKRYSFNKQELIDILNMATIPFHKFYYPLPDYKLPQLIYSENYLPEKNISERLIPYYINLGTLLAYENDLYDDLVDNQVFEFFSNSYLVECSQDQNFCSVNYAAVSVDRGREKSFATTIHNNNMVKKKALYKEGVKNTSKLYANMMDLKNRGINIVPHKLVDNYIVMPYIKSMTLSNYLKELIRRDKYAFLMILDRLYYYILSSAEHVSSEDNVLCNNETRGLDWGIILKKAYIELIPLNSFYIDGEIVFFDQEYVRENYPAKYVMFRALHYLYCFAPYADKIIPLETLKAKYQMTELWDIFMAIENKFLVDIRNRDLYKHFYKWTRINRKLMYKNAKLLEADDEIISDYKVTQKMKKIWSVQLDLLKVFKETCERNQLRYYIIYGTLLGAVRHKGFIPWDDDVDVVMPREDYDKLKKIASNEFKEPYFFQMPENDAGCFYNGYCRLRNSNTTGISLMDLGQDCNQGIWMDIIPLDTCVRDQKKLKKKLKQIHLVQNLLYAKVYGKEYDKFRDMTRLQWKLYYFFTKLYKHKWLCNWLNRALTAYGEENSDYLAIFTHYNFHQPFDKRDFNSTVLLDFENLKLPVPIGYKRCLEMSMGKDYMKYPPLEKRKPHHIGIFNADLPYKKYNALFFNIFRDCKDKTIIVFGAGLMFDDYMKNNGTMYAPAFLVDNDKTKWGTKRHGIDIKAPNAILKVPEEKRKIIICSVYYRQIEEQLKQMGIIDYRIYVQQKDWIVRDEDKGR